jgi:sec-independent protein translocase protein TatC
MAEENRQDAPIAQPENDSSKVGETVVAETELAGRVADPQAGFQEEKPYLLELLDKISLVEHLQTLRVGIIKVILVIGIGFTVSYFFAEQIINFITAPAGKLYYLNPTEVFFSYLKISFVVGTLLALPFILYQIWDFIVPLLSKNKQSALALLVTSSLVLFIGGLTFSYFFVLPAALKFFTGFATEDLQPMLSLGQYLSFFISFLLPFGVIFELPLFLIILGKVGLISSTFLQSKRKVVLVLAFVAGAVISPTPDIFSQVMIAIPLLALYEASIVILKYFMGN